jgi:hypothetical protein
MGYFEMSTSRSNSREQFLLQKLLHFCRLHYLSDIRTCIPQNRSRDSAVGTVTGCRLDGRGSFLSCGKIFFFIPVSKSALRDHTAFYPTDAEALSTGVKRRGRYAGQPRAFNADVTNDGAKPPFPISLHCVMLH